MNPRMTVALLGFLWIGLLSACRPQSGSQSPTVAGPLFEQPSRASGVPKEVGTIVGSTRWLGGPVPMESQAVPPSVHTVCGDSVLQSVLVVDGERLAQV